MAVSFMCLSGLVEETATNWTLGAFPTCKALHQEEVIKGDSNFQRNNLYVCFKTVKGLKGGVISDNEL